MALLSGKRYAEALHSCYYCGGSRRNDGVAVSQLAEFSMGPTTERRSCQISLPIWSS